MSLNLSPSFTSGGTVERANGETVEVEVIVIDWTQRSTADNDCRLRGSFDAVLAESAAAPPEDRLVMYDACDEHEVKASLGRFRKRIDARRNTKPKKPDAQLQVCTPFNPNGFHFGKIRNDRERLVKLKLEAGRYDILTNKFPLFAGHMLLVARALVPQQMNGTHLGAIRELLQACSFCAYFNSWGASASVNHFHCHLIDEAPPVTSFPLVAGPVVCGCRCLIPQGFPGFCYVFPISMTIPHVERAIQSMQADNQPHNLLFTPRFVYVFPKPIERPLRSFDLYPETVGGPELIGSFTVYTDAWFHALQESHIEELVRINTAPLPSRMLQRSGGADDAAVHSSTTTERASQAIISPCLTFDHLPRIPVTTIHREDWPQDRPIARALTNNEGHV